MLCIPESMLTFRMTSVSHTNMMEDAYRNSASVNATTIRVPSDEQACTTTNIARRSMSIFSRRGVMTPEPHVPHVHLESVQISKSMGEEKRTWVLRKRSNGKTPMSPSGKLSRSSRGTILHAVPPASIVRLSALEEEMAHSPNDEILSAISECPPTLGGLTIPSRNPSVDDQKTYTRPSSLRTNSHHDASSRIGVWVDGVVHWNESAPNGIDLSHAQTSASKNDAGRQKPHLSVTIPTGEWQAATQVIHQPQPHRPCSSTQSSVTPPVDRPRAPFRTNSPSSNSRASRSSESGNSVDEDASICSHRSSATSIEAFASVPGKGSPSHFNTQQPSYMSEYACQMINYSAASDDFEKLYQMPALPRRAAPCPPITQDRPVRVRGYTARSKGLLHAQDLSNSTSHAQDPRIASPTWSQAEQDLQRELSTERGNNDNGACSVAPPVFSSSSIHRSGSVREVMQPPSRAPTIPKRSRKREWKTHVAFPASELQRRQSEVQQAISSPLRKDDLLRKSVSVACFGKPGTATGPPPPTRSSKRPLSKQSTVDVEMTIKSRDDVISRRKAIAAAMTPSASTEDVLLHILSRLHSPRDLIHTAIINKGMYRVFQENEIHLLRTTVFNESAALWELLEWTPPSNDEVKSSSTYSHSEHSPSSYMRCYRREMVVVEELKRLILETCQSFLRRETVAALSTPTHPNAQRYDDAFWRIWTFCRIFGGYKNREDDITGQMDWLRGGVLANNEDCIASTEPNMDFDMRSVLISPPACFAESNRGGLSAGQLFDVTEIWTCMTALLQSYHGRVGQARYYGVFDNCDVEEGDVENEAAILEEWTAYLLALGPNVVLEMAQLYPAAGFALARDNGWTRWTPPILNGSRTSFLKEPVAKSYEERVIMAKQRQQAPREQVRKDASRRRVATLAAEIRVRRQSSAYKRSPLIDMTTERAMSMISRRDSISSTSAPRSQGPSVRIVSSPPRLSNNLREDQAMDSDRDRTRDDRSVVKSAEHTGERAIQQLVTMGFERSMAVDALRITDRGDGLRPDRAIDLLLRQQE